MLCFHCVLAVYSNYVKVSELIWLINCKVYKPSQTENLFVAGAFYIYLNVHISPSLSSLFLVFLFSSRTGGHTGARDCFTCRNECQRVRLGFPLYHSSAEGVKIEPPPGISSLNVPESLRLLLPKPHPPFPSPLFPSVERKKEMKFFNYEPITVNKKRICINPGAIESLHKTHIYHITPPP